MSGLYGTGAGLNRLAKMMHAACCSGAQRAAHDLLLTTGLCAVLPPGEQDMPYGAVAGLDVITSSVEAIWAAIAVTPAKFDT